MDSSVKMSTRVIHYSMLHLTIRQMKPKTALIRFTLTTPKTYDTIIKTFIVQE